MPDRNPAEARATSFLIRANTRFPFLPEPFGLNPIGGGRRQRIAVAISIVPAENPARLSTAGRVAGPRCWYAPGGKRPLATSASAHPTHTVPSAQTDLSVGAPLARSEGFTGQTHPIGSDLPRRKRTLSQ